MKYASLVLILATLALTSIGKADDTCIAPAECVPKQDLDVFVALLRNQKCRTDTPPQITLDPVTIIIDKDGRIYSSGREPKPYKLHIDWCNYQLDAQAKVQLQVAQAVAPTWGFRFRLKAMIGFLPVEAVEEYDVGRGLDAGLLFEPFFFFRNVNVNAYVGARAFGAGLGYDLTRNFGLYAGYALAWGTWRSNPEAALYFSFW